jgi:CTP-dependent riboflavin kinase
MMWAGMSWTCPDMDFHGVGAYRVDVNDMGGHVIYVPSMGLHNVGVHGIIMFTEVTEAIHCVSFVN